MIQLENIIILKPEERKNYLNNIYLDILICLIKVLVLKYSHVQGKFFFDLFNLYALLML